MFRNKHPNLICEYQDIIYNEIIDKGKGNRIIVDEGSSLLGCTIIFNGDNCILSIKSNLHNVSFWFEDSGGLISIGSNNTMESGCQFASVEGTKILVGNDCMFSHEIDVRTTDSHSILNSKGERINPSEDIVVGNHVWIGIRSTLLKGTKIGDNCVIGACSLLTAKTVVSNNCVIAGVPATIVKKDITWKRERL